MNGNNKLEKVLRIMSMPSKICAYDSSMAEAIKIRKLYGDSDDVPGTFREIIDFLHTYPTAFVFLKMQDA